MSYLLCAFRKEWPEIERGNPPLRVVRTLEYLANSPLPSYAVPGVILGVLVGGTQLAAAIALLTKTPEHALALGNCVAARRICGLCQP
jgi:hypothetical protein